METEAKREGNVFRWKLHHQQMLFAYRVLFFMEIRTRADGPSDVDPGHLELHFMQLYRSGGKAAVGMCVKHPSVLWQLLNRGIMADAQHLSHLLYLNA